MFLNCGSYVNAVLFFLFRQHINKAALLAVMSDILIKMETQCHVDILGPIQTARRTIPTAISTYVSDLKHESVSGKVPIFMPPNFEEVEGAFGLGLSVRPSVCPSVTLFGSWETQEPLMLESWNFICGMYMENKRTRIFFPSPVLSFWSYAPFSAMYEQPCEENIWRTAKARILIFGI